MKTKFLIKLITPFSYIKNKLFLLILSISSMLIFWQLNAGNRLPKPLETGKSLINIILSPDFLHNLLSSLQLTIFAMFVAIVISSLLSYLYFLPLFKSWIQFICTWRYLTLSGLVFVFTIMSDTKHDLKINLLLFGIIPFFVTTLISSYQEISKDYYNLCITLKMKKWRSLYELIILGKLDFLLEVIRQNFGIAWTMITFVETLAFNEGGIGVELTKETKYLQMSHVFAYLLVILLIGILTDLLLIYSRKKLFRYVN